MSSFLFFCLRESLSPITRGLLFLGGASCELCAPSGYLRHAHALSAKWSNPTSFLFHHSFWPIFPAFLVSSSALNWILSFFLSRSTSILYTSSPMAAARCPSSSPFLPPVTCLFWLWICYIFCGVCVNIVHIIGYAFYLISPRFYYFANQFSSAWYILITLPCVSSALFLVTQTWAFASPETLNFCYSGQTLQLLRKVSLNA